MKAKTISLVFLWLLGVLTLADSTQKDNSNENNNLSSKPLNAVEEQENDGETEKFFGIDKNQYKEQRKWVKQVMDNKEVMFVQ